MSGVIRSRMPAHRPLRHKARVIRFVLVVAVGVIAVAVAEDVASDLVLAAVSALAIVGVFAVSLPR